VPRRNLVAAMRCSLFGKLATKRDFIAAFAPAEFLNVWEPWMQGSLSASQQSLGETWKAAFLTAPIWRFWLGAEICGAPVLGAFMSSVDGIGRYYPLTLFVCADPATAIPPPDINAHDDWFTAAEEFLLSTLNVEISYESTLESLERLSPPSSCTLKDLPGRMSRLKDGAVSATVQDGTFLDLFASLRTANHACTYAAASFWWTVGGGDFQPTALCCRRMPDPILQSGMLTGHFLPDPD
jgi:type VI secretion system protein ImpM